MHMQENSAQENPEQDAPKPEAPKHVILFSYSPQLKAMVRYDALVIGTRDFEENDRPVLNLVHFRHDDIASHHALNGVDWADTLERTLDVPHRCDQENQSFYWLEDDAAKLRDDLDYADGVMAALRAQLAESHESLKSAANVVADLSKPGSGPQLVEAPAAAPTAEPTTETEPTPEPSASTE